MGDLVCGRLALGCDAEAVDPRSRVGPDSVADHVLGSDGVGGQNHLFQGLWTDPTTGLSYARNRWYDARTASWLSIDPLGAVDSQNLYAFVGWAPHMGTDPMGLGDIHGMQMASKIAGGSDFTTACLETEVCAAYVRRQFKWATENNLAYAYAKSRLPELDVQDPRFRALLLEWFESSSSGGCRPAPFAFLTGTKQWGECWDRVDAGFPMNVEGEVKAASVNSWFGNKQLRHLGSCGRFIETVGELEAWAAFGVAFEQALALDAIGMNQRSNMFMQSVARSRYLFPEEMQILGVSRQHVSALRQMYRIGKDKVIALGILQAEGAELEMMYSTSGKHVFPGAAALPEETMFETLVVSYDRAYDAERILLENLAKGINPNRRYTFYLFAEKPYCPGCSSVINQFSEAFPNVAIVRLSPGGGVVF